MTDIEHLGKVNNARGLTVIGFRRGQLMGNCTVLRYSKPLSMVDSFRLPSYKDPGFGDGVLCLDSRSNIGTEEVNLSENFWQYL